MGEVDDNLYEMRKDYKSGTLQEESVSSDPMVLFQHWFDEARQEGSIEANAFTLSTIGLDGVPEGRIVLLKQYSSDGFIFFTNYESSKGRQLAEKPVAGMTFFWPQQERQVRIKGHVNRVQSSVSNEYFAERPRGSRVGAWASPQSQIIPDRMFLEDKVEEITKRFEGKDEISRPDFWGGYLVKPYLIEFWQGRSSRLHDRLQYELDDSQWSYKRLAP